MVLIFPPLLSPAHHPPPSPDPFLYFNWTISTCLTMWSESKPVCLESSVSLVQVRTKIGILFCFLNHFKADTKSADNGQRAWADLNQGSVQSSRDINTAGRNMLFSDIIRFNLQKPLGPLKDQWKVSIFSIKKDVFTFKDQDAPLGDIKLAYSVR